jgi:hypothetical protein
VHVTRNGRPLSAVHSLAGERLLITLAQEAEITANQKLEISST